MQRWRAKRASKKRSSLRKKKKMRKGRKLGRPPKGVSVWVYKKLEEPGKNTPWKGE